MNPAATILIPLHSMRFGWVPCSPMLTFCESMMHWFTLALAVPLGLAAQAMAGYIYTADALYYFFQYTLWMILGLVVLHALAMRWLTDAARKRSEKSMVLRLAGEIQDAAERWYDRSPACGFTTFHAWEYSRSPASTKSVPPCM